LTLLTHPTLDLLHQLGLNGMAIAFGEIEASGETTTLTHPEWLGLLLDREVTYRRDRRLLARLRYARLRHQAAVEDVDYRAARGLDRALFNKLTDGSWIADAILDRIVHNAHRIDLTGHSLRRARASKPSKE
jgi:DNA replication protein DnaC